MNNMNPYGYNGYSFYNPYNSLQPYGFPANQFNGFNQNQNQNQNNNFNTNNAPNNNNQTFNNSINTNKIYVNGIEDARNTKLPFNSDYIFLDNDKALLYRKVVDGTGKMDIQTFEIVPHSEKPKEETPTFDASMFVPKKDFDALKVEIEKLKSVVRSSLDLPEAKSQEGGKK